MVIAHPFSPTLDPATYGVGIVITELLGSTVLDAVIPGGAYDPLTKVGWRTSAERQALALRQQEQHPGERHHVGRDQGPVEPPARPDRLRASRAGAATTRPPPRHVTLTGTVVLDPPTAETGQCGFGTGACLSDGGSMRCWQ